MNQKRALIVAASLLLWAGLTTALSTALQTTKATDPLPPPAGDSRTLTDQNFFLEWTVGPAPGGQSRVAGYIYNEWLDPVDNVQLRVTELDASGRVISSTVRPLGESVPSEDRAAFDVQVPSHGSSYQVTIDTFEFRQEPNP